MSSSPGAHSPYSLTHSIVAHLGTALPMPWTNSNQKRQLKTFQFNSELASLNSEEGKLPAFTFHLKTVPLHTYPAVREIQKGPG